MTINELRIQLDLQPENRIDILKDVARKCNEGYIFVDSNDGHCYLFDRNGNEDDIKKLKKIDNELFYHSNIKSIVIPDSVEWIRYDAFVGCKCLKSVDIPNSVKKIGYGAFYDCENLKSIVISDSVEWIGSWAFEHCQNLTSIIIPDSVEWIGKLAFEHCRSLKSVVFKGKTINQIKVMKYYPFGIEDESIIECI